MAVHASDLYRGGRVKSECMPFTAIPHNSRLFLDFLFEFEKVEAFYAHRPQSQSVLEYARGWLPTGTRQRMPLRPRLGSGGRASPMCWSGRIGSGAHRPRRWSRLKGSGEARWPASAGSRWACWAVRCIRC